MEKLLKVLWVSACIVGFSCAVWLVLRPAPVVIVGNGAQATQKFGGTTGLDSLSLVNDLTVGGVTTLTGATTLSGALGISSLSETISSGSVVPSRSIQGTMSSSATTTACSFLNSSGSSRLVTAIGVIDRGSATSLGVVTWSAGTSTYPGVAAASNWLGAITTRISGADTFTTTSTLQGTGGAMAMWRNGEYLNFVSGSTTNSGVCRVNFF